MGMVNHMRKKDGQNLFLNVAYGLHVVTGTLAKSIVSGSSPTHVIKLQQMLGRGEWNACKGLWWSGVEVKPDKYEFYPGALQTDMSNVDADFDTDTPHSGVAWIKAELGSGLGEFNTAGTPPEGLRGIFETTICKDYDTNGDVIDTLYSTNPALQVADLVTRIGGRPTSRIDWDYWCNWRDFVGDNITYDYTALGIDGHGLTVSLYNGMAFDTLISQRIDPVIEFIAGSGSPGIGVDTDEFSYRAEGKIKANYSQTYTFYVTHDDGAKLWVNGSLIIDQWGTIGTHSATIALTAGTYVDIKLEWFDDSSTAELRLEWESSSQTKEVINHRNLYPKTVDRPRYETHPFFAGPTRLDDAVRTILSLCNSTFQEVNGKLRFFCLEDTSVSASLTNDSIVDGSMSIVPRDVRNLRNSWQAKFRDVDSQYIEEPIDPILIERPELIELAGRKIDGEAIELFNCSVHQAYRTMDHLVKRLVDSKFQISFSGLADTWPILAGDRIEVPIEFRDEAGRDCLVLESNDLSAEETADERSFVVQDWPDFTVYS